VNRDIEAELIRRSNSLRIEIEGLENFINTNPHYKPLSMAYKTAMHKQLRAMKELRDCLDNRTQLHKQSKEYQ